MALADHSGRDLGVWMEKRPVIWFGILIYLAFQSDFLKIPAIGIEASDFWESSEGHAKKMTDLPLSSCLSEAGMSR